MYRHRSGETEKAQVQKKGQEKGLVEMAFEHGF